MKPIEQLSSSWLWNHHPFWERELPDKYHFELCSLELREANEALMIDLRTA